ncbi:MAG: CBASS cGAMP-activated phospholipase [Hyphomicrobiaceae bacterium]
MFRILSLDGGGIKGTFTASVLATLEEATGKSVVEHFDLIVGTSTGGILAIGLGLGFRPKAILDFYKERGPTIFPSMSIVERRIGLLRQLFRPRFSHDVLKQALTNILQDRKFGESRCRLVIPAYDAIAGRIFLLKTAHRPRFVFDIDASAVDVALATSAAPTYFAAAPFPKHEGACYVDGGVWANCPALVGVVEAIGFLDQKPERIDVLSIGTTSEPFNIAKHRFSGFLQWNRGIIDLMFAAQMEAAVAQARLLAQGRLHRINFMTKPGEFPLDDARPEIIRRLTAFGAGEAKKRENLEVVKSRFLNDNTVERFVPFQTVY